MSKEKEIIKYSKVDLEKVDKSGVPALNMEQMNKLLARTPANCRYTRKGKGGKDWEYVKGVYVKKTLNIIFGWDWDFEIVNEKMLGDKSRKDEFIIVLGKLKCRSVDRKGVTRTIVKMQYGRKEVKYLAGGGYLDIGNDFKAAATDALKKCANELGVASDVYQKEDYKYVQIVDENGGGNGSGVFAFMGQPYNDRNQFVDAVRMYLKMQVDSIKDLEEVALVNPNFRKDAEIMELFEERKKEIEDE